MSGQRVKFDGTVSTRETRSDRKAITLYELHTGGKSTLKDPRLIIISAALQEHRNPFWPELDANGDSDIIPASEIELTGLGRLNPDGTLYAALPRNTKVKFEPWARGRKHRTVQELIASGHDMEVLNYATTPSDRNRTTVGVGELTGVRFHPAFYKSGAALWTIVPNDAGSLNPAPPNNAGYETHFTAPSNHVDSVEVIATFPRPLPNYPVQLKRKFKVIEPDGVQAAVRGLPDQFPHVSPNWVIAAGFHLDVTLQPTTVSFYRVQVKEPAANATATNGYYVANPPPNHDSAHGADQWHQAAIDNKIDVAGGFDHAQSPTLPYSVSQAGSFKWPISPIWRVGNGDTTTDSLSGWTDQVFTLGADKKMTVEKFGHSVWRYPNEERGHAQ